MCTSVVSKSEDINVYQIMKGAKVINMADRITNVNYETEPSDEELRQIAEDEDIEFDEEYLEPKEEKDVFGKNELDFYFKQVGKIKVCTPEEEVEYFKKIAAGDMEARNEFVERNLKLVLSNIKNRSQQNYCLSIMDLIQEGNMGLLKAIEKFDPSKGYKFSTYATWWIMQAMNRAIAEKGRTIRMPVHMVECINKYKKTSRNFIQQNGRTPTIKEMAKELDISVERANEIAKRCEEPLSLSLPVNDEESVTLADFIQSKDPSVEEQYEKTEMVNIVEEMLTKLTDRERTVIVARYGIGTGRPQTLEEIGQHFNLTRERIRQIEAKAMRKLKRCPYRIPRAISIKDYLN